MAENIRLPARYTHTLAAHQQRISIYQLRYIVTVDQSVWTCCVCAVLAQPDTERIRPCRDLSTGGRTFEGLVVEILHHRRQHTQSIITLDFLFSFFVFISSEAHHWFLRSCYFIFFFLFSTTDQTHIENC
jgi:hypothetical protein